jgi:hypothetical protein
MTNIVKKIKNVNSLAMFAKLVGLAVVFSVVSCGCKDEVKDATLTMVAITDKVTNGATKFKLKVNVTEGVAALKDYKLVVKSVASYNNEKFKNDATSAVTEADKAKVKTVTTGTLKDLIGAGEELKKEDGAKEIEIEIEAGATCKSAEFVFSVEKGTKEVAGAKDVKVQWTRANN